MNRSSRVRRLVAQIVPWAALLLLPLLVLGDGSGLNAGNRDFRFPPVLDLAIGDPCTVPPTPTSEITYARDGICQRVRDCPTFVPRVIVESFDIRRDVCYFEVHDPVVCCVREPVPLSRLQAKILARPDARSDQPSTENSLSESFIE